jgi:carotenoid cleavage dioxygenase-like enzyme
MLSPSSPRSITARHPALAGLEREHDFVSLRVEGVLPQDLRGSFYRNGPARFDIGSRPHWFDGTGAITAVHLDDGGAQGAVRITHTPSVDHDLAAPTPRYGGFRQPFSRARGVAALFGGDILRNLANINLLPWQDRLYALFEATLPVEIDPRTLANRGETDLAGVIPRGWNAHPHRVAATGNIYQFGLRVGAKVALDVFELPGRGPARLLTSIALPGVMEVHDFFATEHHLIFVLPPLWCSSLALLAKRSFVEALQWRPHEPTAILVVPLATPERVVRMETTPFFFWHSVNAYEDGERIVLDFVRYADFATTKQALDAVSDGVAAAAALRDSRIERLRLDLAQRRVYAETVLDEPCEFPQVHPARHGARHTRAWCAGYVGGSAAQGGFNALLGVDLEHGAVQRIELDGNSRTGEPTIVPRSGAEDDAYILALVADYKVAASYVGVWDAASRAPLAKLWFDQIIPPPLHGCWVAAR